MSSKRDVNPGGREEGPAESQPSRKRHVSNATKVSHKGSDSAVGDKAKKEQVGADAGKTGEGGNTGLQSVFNAMKVGIFGAGNDTAETAQSSRIPQASDKSSIRQEKIPKESKLPDGKKLKPDVSRSAAAEVIDSGGQASSRHALIPDQQAAGSLRNGKNRNPPTRVPEGEHQSEYIPEGSSAKKVNRVRRRREERNQTVNNQGKSKVRAERESNREQSARVGRRKLAVDTEHLTDTGSRPFSQASPIQQEDASTPATDKTFVNVDTERQSGRRRHGWDRLQDITNKFGGSSARSQDPNIESPPVGEEARNSRRDDCPHTGSDTSTEYSLWSDPRSDFHPSLDEPVDALCCKCGDWILVDPKTGRLLDPAPPFRPELCLVCGQPWPTSMPFTQEMENAIRKRLKKSPFKNVLCARCAMVTAPTYADEGVQVDERDLAGNDGEIRDGHYCKTLDLERDKNNARPQSFPDDPSRPNGVKRALLIGINYSGQPHELKGCRNDVVNMYHYLRSNGYKDEHIEILLDIKPYSSPEKDNILQHMERFVKGAEIGDSLFLHYSGHGGQTKDKDGDEPDGEDECIYPVDYKLIPDGRIVDDRLHKILVQVPKGARLTALFDSCHSGSVLDLPFVLPKGRVSMEKVKLRNPRTPEEIERLENCGTIILWSGCKDTQTSQDTKIGGTAVGAMSYAFIKANWELLREKNGYKGNAVPRSPPPVDYTYEELLVKIRQDLGQRSQVPQLSSTKSFRTDEMKVYV